METNILNWLGEMTDEPTYYLRALNLTWDESEVESAMAIYGKLAQRINGVPRLFDELLTCRNWRESLTVYMCLMVTEDRHYFDKLTNHFVQGSFVSPQIAVALSVLHKDQCLQLFQDCLTRTFKDDINCSKQIGAIVSLMPSLGTNVINLNRLKIEASDFSAGMNAAHQHNIFWWMRKQAKQG